MGSLLGLALVSGLVIYVLLTRLDGASEFGEALGQVEATFVFLAILASLTNLLAASLRWKLALRLLGAEVGFGRCVSVILAAFPLIVLAPMKSNELLRAIPLRPRVPTVVSLLAVVVERVLDVVALIVLMCLGALLLGHWVVSLGLLFVAGALLTTGAVFAPLMARKGRSTGPGRWATFSEAIALIPRRPRVGLAVAGASLLSWSMACLIVLALLMAFGVHLPASAVLFGWPLAILVGILPISLAGMGTRDAAFLLTLSWLGIEVASPGAVLASTLGYAALGIWLWVLVGLPFMYRSFLLSPPPR